MSLQVGLASCARVSILTVHICVLTKATDVPIASALGLPVLGSHELQELRTQGNVYEHYAALWQTTAATKSVCMQIQTGLFSYLDGQACVDLMHE